MITREELKYLNLDDMRLKTEQNVVENIILSEYLYGKRTTIVSIDNRYANHILNQLSDCGYRYHQIPKQEACGDKSERELYEIIFYGEFI